MTTTERQRQTDELLKEHAAELARIERRQAATRAHLERRQADELALVKARHRRDLVTLYQAQGRQLGPWALAVLNGVVLPVPMRRGVNRGA